MSVPELVTIKVTSEEGHTEFSLTSKDALSKLGELYNGGERWIYLDGSNVSPSRITESMLTPRTNIKVMNAITGGVELSADFDLHIAPFEDEEGKSTLTAISPNSVFPIVIEYIPANESELRTSPGIKIWVDEKNIAEVIHMRSFLCNGILAKLNAFANNEHNKFKQIYNV